MPTACGKQFFLRKTLPLSAVFFTMMMGPDLGHANNGHEEEEHESKGYRAYTGMNEYRSWFHSPLRDCKYGGSFYTTDINETIRSAHLHPFSWDSIWNTSMGTGAQFEDYSSRRNRDFRAGRSYINSDNGYGIEMNYSNSSDPIRSVTYSDGEKTNTHPIPEDAVIVDGTDGNLNVIDGRIVYEYWKAIRLEDGNYTASYGADTDLFGSGIDGGIRAAHFSTNAGLIRKHELENLHIPHALVIALPGSALKKGWVWPASTEDSSNDDYTGSIPMGSLFAIPPEVDLDNLGLSPEGLMLGRALQDYGAYVGDRASQVSLFASSDVERELPEGFEHMLEDFNDILRNEMLFVTNSSELSPGGGGLRRQPPVNPIIRWP